MARDLNTLARHYAKAFADVVVEMRGEDTADKIGNILEELSILGEEESAAFFSNPVFDREEKLAVLQALTKKKKIEPLVHRFLEQVIALGDIELLSEITKAYGEAILEKKNQIRGTVRTAFPMSKSEEKRLAEGLSTVTGKKVLLEVLVDKDLIGGTVAEVGGVVYDASVKSYLTRLQQEF